MDASADNDLDYVQSAMGSNLDTVLVYNILKTHSYLSPFIGKDLRRHRLTAAQLNTLLLLGSAGGEGLMMGEIGKKLVVTKSNVTGLIDRLERQGFAERVLQDHDRRAITVKLSAKGKKLLDRAIPHHAELHSELTDSLSAKEKETLIRLLSKLRRELRKRRREMKK
ncbi:MAG: MarR family transcriptional regulator [Planctomycetota bacterium]|nr:MAG: MarR family transcriptional regulator [Planctomycetota bacterium]